MDVISSNSAVAEEKEDRNGLPDEQDEEESYRSLITKIWDQDEIEMPKICSALVDEDEAAQAAGRAVQMVLQEADADRDITVPTWTGRAGTSTSSDRSKSLLTSLKATTSSVGQRVFESDRLVIEKQIVRELVGWFRTIPGYAAETETVLWKFEKKISAGQSEIFRSCLRELCEFGNGFWVLKSDHR